MPFFFEPGHYQAIRHLLSAGDIAARVLSNEKATTIGVRLEDGSEVIWGNTGRYWAYTMVLRSEVIGAEVIGGNPITGESTLPAGATAEEVASLIATWDYISAPVTTT